MEKKEVEVKVGAHTFTLVDLDADDMDRVYDYVGNTMSPAKLGSTIAFCSVRKVDGAEFKPLKNALELSRLRKLFSAKEGIELAEAYGNAFGLNEEDVKNEPAAPTSEQQPTS